MELRQLRYFVAVAEELHFGRAAQRLHIVQPALSQQVQRLEAALGVRLLERTKRRVELTEAGRAFLVEARRTLAGAAEAARAARRAAAGAIGRLRVGYVDLATYQVLPAVVRAYRERCPDVELVLVELHREPQREALARGDLDVGFFSLRAGDGEFEGHLLIEEPLAIVLPAGHAAAKAGEIRLGDLSAEPWILFPRELRTEYVELVLRACAAAGFSPRVVQEAAQLHTIAALVSAGLGVSMLPLSVAAIPRAGVAHRSVAGAAAHLPLSVVWRRDDVSSAAAQFCAIAAKAFGAADHADTRPRHRSVAIKRPRSADDT
jgi:DNA-binding transcriptional LysR family regulator